MDFLKQNEIQIYSTNSDLKAVFVERFNRTLLDLIKEPMYIEGKACWLNHLDAALQKYNNRVHGTTKMTPFEMSTNNQLIPNNTEGALRNNLNTEAKRCFATHDEDNDYFNMRIYIILIACVYIQQFNFIQ